MTHRNLKRRPRTFAAGLVAAGVAASVIAPAGASAAEPPLELKFDFGGPSSPVLEGWTGVHPGTAYTADAGYGFITPPSTFRDRAGDDAMLRDFTIGGAPEFAVDLPNGTYEVTTWTGDLIAGNRTNFDVEGNPGGAGSNTGQIHEELFPAVQVADGQLNIRVTGGDGRINGIRIQSPVPAPAGLAASEVITEGDPSVSLVWEPVADAIGYTVYRGPVGGELVELGQAESNGFTDATVGLGETYQYAVGTNTGDRNSSPSEPIEVSVVDESVEPPAVPSGLTATDVGRNDVTLVWNDDDAVVQWKVYRSTREDIPFELVATVDEPTFTDGDVLTTRPYLYKLVAINAGGTSAESETVSTPISATLVRQAEYLDRAPVAVALDEGVYVGWRLLGLDDRGLGFNVYRDGVKVNEKLITGATNLVDAEGGSDSQYQVTALVDGEEISVTDVFGAWDEQFLDIPLKKPADGVTPTGEAYSYSPGDASVGDLDGDGELEIVLAWNPSNAQDNSIKGYTGNVILDAYELDGTQLWRMDLGVNIRAGAHYTQFQVYDLDGDGRAEVSFKTADGTTDGVGTVVGDPTADHRNADGYILSGPEFLTVFDGQTGAALDTVEYKPGRGDVGSWGDTYGNRVDRFLAGIAYFDGERPSLMFSRGYYTRSVLVAWDFRDGKLTERWTFDSNEWGEEYEEQGNHQITTTDVDRDGLDEVVFGAMTIDDDGTPLYNSNLLHGDVLHVGDHVTDRPGKEIFSTFESPTKNGGIMAAMRDAETGEILWKSEGTFDTGRGSVADIDPNHPGAEAWHVDSGAIQSTDGLLKTADGEVLSTVIPDATFPVYWDGDPLRELVSQEYNPEIRAGVPLITKWNPETNSEDTLLRADGLLSNGTQSQPLLQADLFGDWREELVFRHADGNALRLLTTVDITEVRIPTLMHDPQYRQSVAWQSTAYNQPPHTSFFIGADMAEPPQASIKYVGENPWPGGPVDAEPSHAPEPVEKKLLGGKNQIDLGLGDEKFPRGESVVALQNLAPGTWVYVFLNDAGLGWHKVSEEGSVSVATPSSTRPGDNRFVVLDESGGLVGWDRMFVTGAPVKNG